MKGRRYPEIAKTGAVLGAFLAVLGFQLLYSIYEGDNTMLSDSVFSLLSFGAFPEMVLCCSFPWLADGKGVSGSPDLPLWPGGGRSVCGLDVHGLFPELYGYYLA